MFFSCLPFQELLPNFVVHLEFLSQTGQAFPMLGRVRKCIETWKREKNKDNLKKGLMQQFNKKIN